MSDETPQLYHLLISQVHRDQAGVEALLGHPLSLSKLQELLAYARKHCPRQAPYWEVQTYRHIQALKAQLRKEEQHE